MALLKKRSIEVVGFWQREIEDASELIYVCKFGQESQSKERWASFRAGPEWIRAKAAGEASGPRTRDILTHR